MPCVNRIVVVILDLIGMAGVMQAQTIPGYTLQETVLVRVTGAAVSSQTTLLQGTVYKLRAVGTAEVHVPGYFGSYLSGDAEYAFNLINFFPFFPFFPPGEVSYCSGVAIGLAVNNTSNGSTKAPVWGPYNPAHIYTANFTGTGSPISINYHSCAYYGSQGLLTVQILRPMGMNLPTAGQPGYTDVSPGLQTFPPNIQQSISGRANALAVSADGMRLYAGTFAGVWRSDDAGLTWRQMTLPQPAAGVDAVPGGLFVPDVYDIAVSPQDPDVVMVSVFPDLHAFPLNGVYRSENGGNTWNPQFACPDGSDVSQIVFAPDNANLVYAAGGCGVGVSQDGGKGWTLETLPGGGVAWHVAVAPFEPPLLKERAAAGGAISPWGVRRVYALGTNQMYYSTDGGQTWTQDSGLQTIANLTGVGGEATSAGGNSSRVLVVEPGNSRHVLLAVPGLSNGSSFYDNPKCGSPDTFADGVICNLKTRKGAPVRKCGEGSIWLGDFTGFSASEPAQQSAAWSQLNSPSTYWGVTTPSGNTYLDVKPAASGYLLFLSDKSHVHVSAGLPTFEGWHRMEGLDASQTVPQNHLDPYCNQLFVHVDPHAIVTSSDFSMTLQAPPAAIPFPYNENTVAGPVSTGDIWMANDGGVYHATGAQPNWHPAGGLSTLASINVAGLAVKGFAPALYFGTGDNADFFSLDGGNSWKQPRDDCGDCDAWFADPAQVQQVMGFMPGAGGGGYYVFTNSTQYPDAEVHPTDSTMFAHWVCPTACNASSSYWIRGYRPMVLTPPGVNAPATGDYVIIGTKSDGTLAVFRKTDAAPMTQPSDWDALQYGPALPPCATTTDCIDVVQASGGHAAPVLYAGDPATGPNSSAVHSLTLWKWSPGTAAWQQIVPSPASTATGETATNANRFFVDPFNPNTIYLLDDSIKRSDDGGATWQVDVNLDNAITENHRYSYTADSSVIKDIIFVRGESATRFAVGSAGVFYTLDGANWTRVLSTSALPGHPVAAYFDGISDPCDRALYVALAGRGILRIDPIPTPGRLGISGLQPCLNQILNNAKR